MSRSNLLDKPRPDRLLVDVALGSDPVEGIRFRDDRVALRFNEMDGTVVDLDYQAMRDNTMMDVQEVGLALDLPGTLKGDVGVADLPRRWQLDRREDVSGMSGTGIVAEGIEFIDGSVAYRWLTAPSTTQTAGRIGDVEHIHGHGNRTVVRWMDDDPGAGE